MPEGDKEAEVEDDMGGGTDGWDWVEVEKEI